MKSNNSIVAIYPSHIAHGSAEDITHAKEILNRTDSETLEHHQ